MTHFTEEQLKELATIFGLKKVDDVLPVRDGFVTKSDMVWWRSNEGPVHLKAGNPSEWHNIKNYPFAYQLNKPLVRFEYVD